MGGVNKLINKEFLCRTLSSAQVEILPCPILKEDNLSGFLCLSSSQAGEYVANESQVVDPATEPLLHRTDHLGVVEEKSG